MTTSVSRAGCSYFGVRIPRHVRRDMADLATRGLHRRPAHVLRERLRLLPRHDGRDRRDLARRGPERAGEPVGARPHVRRRGREPLGRVPSRGVPGAGRRAHGSRPPASTARPTATFCKEWADWVLECGVDSVFWDEPAWVVPVHVGVDDPDALDVPLRPLRRALRRADPRGADARGAGLSRGVGRRFPARDARARLRARRLERDLPPALDRGNAGALRLERGRLAARPDHARHRPVLEALGRLGRGVRPPLRPAAARDGRPARGRERSSGCRASASRARTSPTSKLRSPRRARKASHDIWTWGYEACGHMTSLATPDAPLVWDAVSAALTARPQTATTEAARPDLADLDLRSTRDLVRLLNDEDATVPAAVAEAGDALAAAIDAIVERMRRGGRARLRRRRHVGSPGRARRGRVRHHVRLATRRGPRRHRRAGRGRGRSCGGDERTARAPPPARGLRRRRQRERRHPVRARRAARWPARPVLSASPS